MAAPTAARLTRWAEGHRPDQTKLTDTTKPKGPVSLIVARLRRFNLGYPFVFLNFLKSSFDRSKSPIAGATPKELIAGDQHLAVYTVRSLVLVLSWWGGRNRLKSKKAMSTGYSSWSFIPW